MNKKIAVTGRDGNLDRVLVERFNCIRLDADVLNCGEIREAIQEVEPDVIINCAAYTNVDECELGSNRHHSLKVNSLGIGNIRDEFEGQIIHISTDYIFNGIDGPYDEKAIPDPICWYGHTKLCGEKRFQEYLYPNDVIVRTTVLYGGHRPDFANTVLKKLKLGFKVEAPETLYGNPTHVYHLAIGLMKVIELSNPPEIINIVGKETISRYDFAHMLAVTFGYDPKKVIATRKVSGIAKRPMKAGLKTNRAFVFKVPIFTVQEGIDQLFLEKANIYAHYPEK